MHFGTTEQWEQRRGGRGGFINIDEIPGIYGKHKSRLRLHEFNIARTCELKEGLAQRKPHERSNNQLVQHTTKWHKK